MNDSEEKEVQVEVPKRSFGTKIIWGSLIALAVALGFFGLVFPYIQPENLSAEQIAEEWVDGNIDALEKEMVTFVAGNDWEVQDLGESVVGALVREKLGLAVRRSWGRGRGYDPGKGRGLCRLQC